MTRLTNLRHVDGRHGPEVAADFTAPDGRLGSVTVPLAEYEAHGDEALRVEAAACVRQSRRHGYRPPEADRFAEIH